MGKTFQANYLLLFSCVYENVRTATVFWKCFDVLARCYSATRVVFFRSVAFIFFVLVGFFAQLEGSNAQRPLKLGPSGRTEMLYASHPVTWRSMSEEK